MMEMLPIVTACRYLTCDIVRCQVWGKLGKGRRILTILEALVWNAEI